MSLLEKIFCISSTKNKDEQILNIAWLFSCADRPRQMKQDKKLATAKIIIFISKCTMPSENELGIKKNICAARNVYLVKWCFVFNSFRVNISTVLVSLTKNKIGQAMGNEALWEDVRMQLN